MDEPASLRGVFRIAERHLLPIEVADLGRGQHLGAGLGRVPAVIDIAGSARVPAAKCKRSCVVTREFTPIEPDVEANKSYAPNIGLILEEEDGERVELIEFTAP